MPKGWQWDETLFRGSARFYVRGRLPYASGLADAVAETLGLDGRGSLLDVGCGPGIVALRLAHLFEQVVGLDADADMLREAEEWAADLGISNTRWVCALAEDLPAGLGIVRVATFARSFHWMDRDRVSTTIFAMLEPGGAFVQINDPTLRVGESAAAELPYPRPPREPMQDLIREYLGPIRRAGQGILRDGTPDGEAEVLARAGFEEPEYVQVAGPAFVVRTIDDLVAEQFSSSGTAPYLFGSRLPQFEADLRELLQRASSLGLFAEPTGDTEVRFWRKPRSS